MIRWFVTALLTLLRYRWRSLLYPAMLLLAGVCTMLPVSTEQSPRAEISSDERCANRSAPVEASAAASESRDLQVLWEHAVTHPILALFFILGLIHALELSQHVTLPLLRQLRRQVERIVEGGAKHNEELDQILTIIFRRRHDR